MTKKSSLIEEGDVITPRPPDYVRVNVEGIITPKPPRQVAIEEQNWLKELEEEDVS